MAALEKSIGALVQSARALQGYRSARALADAAGIGERSVAGLESGDRFGPKTVGAVERTLGMPRHAIKSALDSGDLSTLEEFATRKPADEQDAQTGGDEPVGNAEPSPALDVDDLSHLSLEMRREAIREVIDALPKMKPLGPAVYWSTVDQAARLAALYWGPDEGYGSDGNDSDSLNHSG